MLESGTVPSTGRSQQRFGTANIIDFEIKGQEL